MLSIPLEPASWPRRLGALVIDWAACWLVALLLAGPAAADRSDLGWWPLGIFLVEATLGTALAGGSFGQLLTRIRVLHTDGRPLSLLLALARTALICLVIPPLVFRGEDGRGLHDMWTRSAAYRLTATP